MLRPEVERPSDVDLAIEVAPKEADFDRARVANYERVEKLAQQGHRFQNFLDQEFCWYQEVFRFLKGRSRVLSVADYKAEKALVLTVPHRVLLGDPEPAPAVPAPEAPQRPVREKAGGRTPAPLERDEKGNQQEKLKLGRAERENQAGQERPALVETQDEGNPEQQKGAVLALCEG
jgi:hypothetical protein